MTPTQRDIANRIVREQIDLRAKENMLIRKRFGERITIAYTSECETRDREIEALELLLAGLADA